MKNKIILLGLIAIIGTMLFMLGCKNIGCSSNYTYETIANKKIIQSVEASGTVNPVKSVNIGSQVSGIIKEIYVDFNSEVKKGQLLAEIDPSLFQAQVDKARGDLLAAQANYQKIKSTLDFEQKNYRLVY